MKAIELICYFALLMGFLGLATFAVFRKTKTDLASALHFSLLFTMSYQGLSSLFFWYTDIPLSFSSMGWALLIGNIIALFNVLRISAYPRASGNSTIQPIIDSHVIFAMAMSYLSAAIAGILFFTTDLIPSSMTGDPARHFQSLIDLSLSGPAAPLKPVYNLWAGTFTYFPAPLAQDKLFVIFNIFVLGLLTCSVSLVTTRVFGIANWRSTGLVILLTAFGYPFFALQYGYYTLLLSSAFLFSSFALLLDYLKNENASVYFLYSVLACGVSLTHPYFVPELLLTTVIAALWHCKQMQRSPRREFFKRAPYWIFVGCITVLSMGSSVGQLGAIIQAKGWGTEDSWANILPFATFSIPYFLSKKASGNRALLLLVVCSAGFSLAMYALYINGLAASYYVNRNQLILIPLLAVGTAGTLQLVGASHARASDLLRFIILLVVLLPYFHYRNAPLATSNTTFLNLLSENSGFHYLVNAKTVSYSPLQFTARDRTLLTSAEHMCLGKTLGKLLVLGTDHEVIWFGIYANVYPSLTVRNDGFIYDPDYIANYKIWKADSDTQYIAVIKHINYTIPRSILSEIESSTEVVCAGDSFVIYRKLDRQS